MGFCNVEPVGTNNPGTGDKAARTVQIHAGDTVRIATPVLTMLDLEVGTHEPIDVSNFAILFALSDQLFAAPAYEMLYTPEEYYEEYGHDEAWVAAYDGSMQIKDGKIIILIHPSFTEGLRRGSYTFAIRATDLRSGHTATLYRGTVLVRYAPTTPHRDIPYPHR